MCKFAVAALGYNCIFIFVATDPNLTQLLQYRFQHLTPSPGCIEDVYDGLVYRSFSNPNSMCHLHSTMMMRQNLSHLGYKFGTSNLSQ